MAVMDDNPPVGVEENASEPATLKAISEESVSWYLPSTSVTRTSTIG